MYRFKKLSSAALCFLIAQSIHAQQHNNSWFRGTLSFPLSKKLRIDNEFQHRRQNGYENSNLFDKNLMFTYRNWIHYQINENALITLSPFAYFSNYKIILRQEDENSKPNKEIRLSGAILFQQNIVKRFYAEKRTTFEYRRFEGNRSDITRLRNRFGLRYEFTSKIELFIFDELFFNLSGTTHYHFFDHNRLGIDFEYSVLPFLGINTGYIHITRLPLNSTTILYENNFFLNLTYRLLKHTKARNKVHTEG